ncbi:unnamed protein product [Caenorhabditis angaria]|uniref:Uncharacterized protein n=1 Tax=Caenorhabditis angaria TaxID=860376 RepID=A0A9P1MWC3_9PELO|nr:unnamed protein product [Caenorhabditis angaria]
MCHFLDNTTKVFHFIPSISIFSASLFITIFLFFANFIGFALSSDERYLRLIYVALAFLLVQLIVIQLNHSIGYIVFTVICIAMLFSYILLYVFHDRIVNFFTYFVIGFVPIWFITLIFTSIFLVIFGKLETREIKPEAQKEGTKHKADSVYIP